VVDRLSDKQLRIGPVTGKIRLTGDELWLVYRVVGLTDSALTIYGGPVMVALTCLLDRWNTAPEEPVAGHLGLYPRQGWPGVQPSKIQDDDLDDDDFFDDEDDVDDDFDDEFDDDEDLDDDDYDLDDDLDDDDLDFDDDD
jgi:hypothetical protein